MCWTRQSGCAVTRSTTAFVSATDVKMVGKHASACGYADDRTSSLCSSGGCMLFPLKESTSSLLFLRHWSGTRYCCCILSPIWCRCSLFCSGFGRKPRPTSTISTSCRQQEENLTLPPVCIVQGSAFQLVSWNNRHRYFYARLYWTKYAAKYKHGRRTQ